MPMPCRALPHANAMPRAATLTLILAQHRAVCLHHRVAPRLSHSRDHTPVPDPGDEAEGEPAAEGEAGAEGEAEADGEEAAAVAGEEAAAGEAEAAPEDVPAAGGEE